MSDFKRFDLEDVDSLREALAELSLELPISDDFSIFSQPLQVAGNRLPNRFIVQPMEGVDADPETGSPSDLTFRRYHRFAEGGSSLIWAESISVVPEGRSNPKQLWLTDRNLDDYKRLVEKTKAAAQQKFGRDVLFIIQLTHSGRACRPEGKPAPMKAQHNPYLDGPMGMVDAEPVNDDYLDRLQDDFVRAGCLAANAGFDGVDMKVVHGYLVAELLGAHTRKGKYGGSYENRTRFFRETVLRLMEELPASCFVTSRITALEPCPYPYGWGVAPVEGDWMLDLAEPKQLVRQCAEWQMPLFNASIGLPRYQPYMNRPHDGSLIGAPPPPENPLEGVARFQAIVREMQQTVPEMPAPTAGLTWLRHLMPYVAAGLLNERWCTLIGQGRGALAYPDSVRDILETGKLDPQKCCTTCSMCSQIMADGVGCSGCVVRDRDIYGPELKKGRRK